MWVAPSQLTLHINLTINNHYMPTTPQHLSQAIHITCVSMRDMTHTKQSATALADKCIVAQALAHEVACYLGLELGGIKIKRFADGEIYVQVQVQFCALLPAHDSLCTAMV